MKTMFTLLLASLLSACGGQLDNEGCFVNVQTASGDREQAQWVEKCPP